MDINEAFRRVVAGHLRLIVALVLLPVAATFALSRTAHVSYVASARIQASSATVGSDTEADSLLNRVKGIATSTSIVDGALHTVGVTDRSTTDVASKEITVTRLGSSAVMDISVTDADAAVAQRLASALADSVVAFLGGQGSQQSQSLIDQLTTEQNQLYAQQQKLLVAVAQANGVPATDSLTSQLSTVDQQLSDIATTIRQLRVTIATNSSASLISKAAEATRVRTSVTTDLVLAGIAGLVGALLIASVLEIVIPRVADARAFARELGVPVLGTLAPHKQRRRLFGLRGRGLAPQGGVVAVPDRLDSETILAVRHAVSAAGVTTVALTRAGLKDDSSLVAAGLAARLGVESAPAALNGQQNGHRHPASPLLVPSAATWGSGTRVQVAKAAPAAMAPPPMAPPKLRIVPIADLGDKQEATSCALLVTVGRLSRFSQVHRIKDLAAATGWPVIGVLDDRSTTGRGQS